MKKGGESMSTIKNNAKIVSSCGQRLIALKKYVKATKTAMTVSGESMKLADLTAIYQAAIDTRNALVPQRAAYEKALAARDSAEVTRQATDKKLKAWVVNQFGADSEAAQEFGFLPTKVGEIRLPPDEGRGEDGGNEGARSQKGAGDTRCSRDHGEATEGEDQGDHRGPRSAGCSGGHDASGGSCRERPCFDERRVAGERSRGISLTRAPRKQVAPP
jgi:hypothetical protein